MMHEGVSVDVILAWKRAGIDERVILAVLGR